MRAVNPAKLFRAGMHMNEGHLRPRNVEQRVALRRQLAEPAAYHDDEVRRFDAFKQFRIGANAKIASVTGMHLIE